MQKIKALVAARSGSVRVEEKNTRKFAGTTLIENKLEQLQRISSVDGVIVSSDDSSILELAERYGYEAMLREAQYATGEISMSDVYEHMAERCEADAIVYLNCTSPLVRDSTIEALIQEFRILDGEFDSINTASRVRQFLFFEGLAINYNLKKQPRSQDLPEILSLNFAVNVISRESMIGCKNVVANKPNLRVIDEVEAFDIDTLLDFEVAEFIYEQKGGMAYLTT